jgi:hypothetical protein
MTAGISFQIVQGIWSPADRKHSYVIVDDFLNYKDAKRAAAEFADSPSPIAILEIRSKVLWRNAAQEALEPTKVEADE